MITKIEVSFELKNRIVIFWFEDFNWECLEFDNEKAAKLKLVELVLKMG